MRNIYEHIMKTLEDKQRDFATKLAEIKVRECFTRTNGYINQLKDYHIPIFKYDQDKKIFYVVGSSICLKVNGCLFLISAAHVFDELKKTDLYVYVNNKECFPIEGETMLTPAENGRENDIYDTGIIKLKNELLERMPDKCCITIDRICCKNVSQKNNLYGFIGYPSTKSKSNPESMNIKTEAWGYTNHSVDDDIYEKLGLDKRSHIVVKFAQERCVSFDKEMKRYTFPKPKGMSGGGVWLFERYNSSKLDFDTINKLVGIALECHSRDIKVFVGVNIGLAIQTIKEQYPELNIKLPGIIE